MSIHLPNNQTIYFEEGREEEALQKSPDVTMLTGWFELNDRDEEARKLLYTEVGKNYRWVNKKWQKRKVF